MLELLQNLVVQSRIDRVMATLLDDADGVIFRVQCHNRMYSFAVGPEEITGLVNAAATHELTRCIQFGLNRMIRASAYDGVDLERCR